MPLIKTHAVHKDFVNLIQKLDAYLKITDGEDHSFYNQYNGLETIKHVVIYYKNNVAIGCGAFKKHNATCVELKRMFVLKEYRNQGVAKKIIHNLEAWAKQLGYKTCILETGKRQTEAVKFYKTCNYTITNNYGQYIGMTNSICFKKNI